MSARSARGLLVLPAAVALAGALALASGASRPQGRVRLELAAVLPLPEGDAGLVVLREKESGRLLPLVVPDRELFGLGRRASPGIAARTLAALGAEVREVELEAAEESAEGALVRVRQDGKEVELPGRPSESLALALAAGAPIVVRRRLLDREGLDPEELEAARRAAKQADEVIRM